MADHRLKQLVDLVLLVGPDQDTGLTYRYGHNKTRDAVDLYRNRNRREGDELEIHEEYYTGNHNHRPSSFDELSGSLSEDSTDDEFGLVEHLTDEAITFHAQETQMLTSNEANYPHRDEQSQLIDYPQSLYTQSEKLRDGNLQKLKNIKINGGSQKIDEQSRGFESAASATKTRQSLYTKHQSITPLTPNPTRRMTVAQVLGSDRKLSYQAIARRVSELQSNGMRDSMNGGSTATMVSRTTTQMSLNADQIGALCQLSFPEGLRCREIDVPPRILPYVLTNLEGDRFYAVTLTFFRKYRVTKHKKTDTTEKPDYDLFPDSSSERTSAQSVVYVPNCCVLVSSQPYFNTLQECLTTYYKELSENIDNLDKITAYLAQSLTAIPIPAPCDDIYINTKVFPYNEDTITIKGSSHVSRAVVDLDMSIIIRLFEAESVCKILRAILTEQKIVFISHNYSMLTLIQEAFMQLIYPFRWQSLYVPVLSSAMVGLVEAPGYLVMGAHRQFETTIKQVEGLMIVDLDNKKILSDQTLTSHLTLPLQATTNFCARLVDTNCDFSLENVGVVVTDEKEARRKFRDKVNKEILDFSLDLMVALFGSIHRFLINEQQFFNQEAFLEQVHEDSRAFYQIVLDTTLFKQFLRERFAYKQFQDLFDVKAVEKQEPISRRPRPASFKSHERGQLTNINFSNHTLQLANKDDFRTTQEDRMTQIEVELETPAAQSNKLYRASLLYLLSSFALNRDLALDAYNPTLKIYAVRNLLEVEQLSSVLFPRQTMLDIINTLDQPQVLFDHTKPVYRPLLRELISEAKAQVKRSSYDVKVDLDNLPRSSVNLVEFYKYAERLDMASDRKTLNRLFNAFTLGEKDEIEPEDINSFYECWKDNEAQCKEIELTCQAKHADFLRNETVLKVSSEVIRTSLCTGYLILTQRRLILLDNSCKVEPLIELTTISQIEDVCKVDIKAVFRATVEALRIISSSPKLKDKKIDLFLRQDCLLWQEMLQEMIGGKKIATETKDMFMMKLVTQNVTLLNTLIMSSRESQCYYGCDLQKAIDALVYYSLDQTVEELAIDSQKENDTLVHRLNPNSDELDCCDVECLFYVPGTSDQSSQPSRSDTYISNSPTEAYRPRSRSTGSGDSTLITPPTLWCGMSNGKIRVFDATSWSLCSRFVQADQRVVCLAYDGDKIWAGSFDYSIYIINNNLSNLNYERLSEHEGFVVDLQLGPDQSTMYSADINGNIYLWACKTRQILKTISVDTRHLTKILPITPTEIWCGCKDKIVNVDANGLVISLFTYVDENDRREELDCFQIIGDRLWAGCGQLGRAVIWDIKSEERLGTLPVSSRGISELVDVDGVIYIGCKITFKNQQATHAGDGRSSKRVSLSSLQQLPRLDTSKESTINRSLLYAVTTHNCHVIKEISAHNDTIRCIHAVSNKYVITGSGSKEGKIAIWKHHSQTRKAIHTS